MAPEDGSGRESQAGLTPLLESASEVQAFLENDGRPFMVIGGLAVELISEDSDLSRQILRASVHLSTGKHSDSYES